VRDVKVGRCYGWEGCVQLLLMDRTTVKRKIILDWALQAFLGS
jgi:hypothetical protein